MNIKLFMYILLWVSLTASLHAQDLQDPSGNVLQIEEIEIMGTAREPLVINIAATARIDFSNFIISRSFSDEILDQVFITRGDLGRLGVNRVYHPYSKTTALLGGATSAVGGYLIYQNEKSGVVVLSSGGVLLLISGILYLSGK
ncbi:MAG: hypothetical protein ACP5FK_02980 [bacterium]